MKFGITTLVFVNMKCGIYYDYIREILAYNAKTSPYFLRIFISLEKKLKI